MFNAIIMIDKYTRGGEMNVNLHLTGELENFINNLVESGIAANKTEAIRLAIARMYYEERKQVDKAFNQSTIEAH